MTHSPSSGGSVPPNDPTKVPSVTRRRFLQWSGVLAGAGALTGAGAYGLTRIDDLTHAAKDNPLPPADGVLVVVTLYGGNDGLNTVVPAADPAYQDQRKGLAYKPEQVLDLGDGLGLSPGMTGLKQLWDEKRLGIVRGVGYPDPDHSHFTSMAIWQSASPKSPSPAAGSGAGSTTTATPCAPSRSKAPCRPCWPANA